MGMTAMSFMASIPNSAGLFYLVVAAFHVHPPLLGNITTIQIMSRGKQGQTPMLQKVNKRDLYPMSAGFIKVAQKC
jgi:hypothetical protein